MESSKVKLNPDAAEIIVSSKDKVVASKAIADNLMSNLFVSWVNEVLCSKSFNGKVNSIKEGLSDEITKSAKNVIGSDWENSPIRTYLNQLRRHVRGEEFNHSWNNGVLSSISAVLIKGDEWEQLLNFMQSKGMYDYRIAFALYGVLNGFANMTRDFTDLLLTTDSIYLSKVYREMYGQLLEKSIPETTNKPSTIETKKPEKEKVEEEMRKIVLQNPEEKSLKDWQNGIKEFAASVIKRDKQKLLNSLEDAFAQNGDNQDYFVFITMLDNFEGWKPGKNGPSTTWTRLQEHYVPDYNQRVGKPAKKQSQTKKPTQQEKCLFDGFVDGLQNVTQSVINAFTGDEDKTGKEDLKQESSSTKKAKQAVSRVGKSILEDTTWIYECSTFISDTRVNRQFIEDMEWFVGNHNDTYYNKKKGKVPGHYAGSDRTNERVLERIRAYMDNKLHNKKEPWLAKIYANIPIQKIIDYISRIYGI